MRRQGDASRGRRVPLGTDNPSPIFFFTKTDKTSPTFWGMFPPFKKIYNCNIKNILYEGAQVQIWPKWRWGCFVTKMYQIFETHAKFHIAKFRIHP
jgi:hypothetical protein